MEDPQSKSSKPAKLKKETPVPVSCGVVTESVEAEKIHWGIVSTGRVYYSEPFPGNNHTYKFRVKLVREEDWCLYITWIPSSILMYDAEISYTVEGILSHGPNLGRKCVTKQRCNEWFVLYSHGYACSLSIINIIVNKSATTVRRPNPLWSMLDDDENTDHKVELIGSDSAKVKVFQRVLESHSEVFRLMFAGDWRENKEKCCAKQLYMQLTPENVMQILQLASLYEYKPLVTLVSSYWEEHSSLV